MSYSAAAAEREYIKQNSVDKAGGDDGADQEGIVVGRLDRLAASATFGGPEALA